MTEHTIYTRADGHWTRDESGTVRRYDAAGELFATVPPGPACDVILAQLADLPRAEQASSTPVADALAEVNRVQAERERTLTPPQGRPWSAWELDALRKLADAVRSHGIGAELGQLREQRATVPDMRVDLAVGGPGVYDGITVPEGLVLVTFTGHGQEERGLVPADEYDQHARPNLRDYPRFYRLPADSADDDTPSTGEWFAESKAAGCTGTGYDAENDTIEHRDPGPCPVHPGL